LKLRFWTGFSWLFLNQSFFSLDEDFGKKVVSLDAENLAESWVGNWAGS